MQSNPAIQRSLPSKAKENSVRPFFFYNLLNKVRRYRQKINLVRNLFVSLNGCNVRINKYAFYSLFSKGFQALGTGKVE